MSAAERIAQYIVENGVPQKQLAQRANMSETALSLSLNGKRRLLADEYIRICNALCLPCDKFGLSNYQCGICYFSPQKSPLSKRPMSVGIDTPKRSSGKSSSNNSKLSKILPILSCL